MRTFFSCMGREFKLIFRNGITIFMVAAPAILALVFILVFGAVNETTLKLAVDNTLDAALVERLESVADLERFDDTEKMLSRVRGFDAVAGVTMENGAVTAVFEGNEGQSVIDSTKKLVGLAVGAPAGGVPYQSEAVQAKGGLAYTLSMIGMLLMALFVGGATVGLSIVDERENGVLRAVAVSPLRLGGYAATKLAPALLLGLAGISAAALIIGKAALLPRCLLLALVSLPVSGMMTFALGAFAGNQIAAIGVLKLLIPLSMILPISAVFVPQQWQFLYYILPMYWQYRALSAVLAGSSILWPTVLTLLVGTPWLLAAAWYFAKKTKFRTGR